MKYLKWMFVVVLLLFLALPAVAQQPAGQVSGNINQQINSMDANKDGKISQSEYIANCDTGDCAKKFDTMDRDKNGFLSNEEARAIASQSKQKLREAGSQVKEKTKATNERIRNRVQNTD
jgi:curli biogenesis system outer membrane secretion channel CsgG